MSILRKLKSLFGRDTGDRDADRDVTVTVEHDPANEAAVKGADVEESSDTTQDESDDAGEPADDATDSETTDVGSDAADGAPEADDASVDEASADADESAESVEIEDAEEPADTEESADIEESADTDESVDADESNGGGATESDASDAAAAGPVDELNGIGPAYAERLEDANVDSVADLAAADAGDLADATEIAEGRIQGWVDQADEY